MPQLLLEIFSEEIPARMQAQAARDLERMAREKLAEAGLLPEALTAFGGARRLTLVAEGLPAAQGDRKEERKGPRANAPEQALEGFLRSTGLTRDQLTERDGVLYAVIERKGRPTSEIIAEMVDSVVRSFPWPKSMTWGYGKLRWVRPIKRILCVFDGEIVPFAIDGIESGDTTQGHRFMGSGQPFKVKDFDSYRDGLAKHYVVLDSAERRERIQQAAQTLAFARGLEIVEDEGLLAEVTGLAEWPTPVLGDMDPAFLDLPPEVIRTSMRTHQKYFAVRDPKTGGLAPHFVTVANVEASDGGATIAQGNAKVLSARLSDARFFWDNDKQVGFEAWLKKLDGVTFHAKLGTMAERVQRIVALAAEIAPLVGADAAKAVEAARLAKADLTSGMVGEFPELQGLMGGYYARAAGMDGDVADAIRDHYRPQGPGDAVPAAPVSIAVALADKLDTLVGFFSIDEKPTGSRDPYALRRAALGVIRILLEHRLRLPLVPLVARARFLVWGDVESRKADSAVDDFRRAYATVGVTDNFALPPQFAQTFGASVDSVNAILAACSAELTAFFADRLKVVLKDQGKRHDLVDAVFALGDDDLVRIVDRVEALDAFLKTEDGANLLAGYKRASNILKAEEKKGPLPSGVPANMPGAPAEEHALFDALVALQPKLDRTLAAEDFAGAMTALAALRNPVDAFFVGVLVNDTDVAVRDNRLRLLSQVRTAMGRVADFSLIAG
ncbi:MAG: glycine--tRNA ligase subunit beta [Caulobacter sp.]|nr:glycine--tRNA ligase subunit beta [Caulobacter sp.]